MHTRRIFLYFIGSTAAAGLSACTDDPQPGDGSESSDGSDNSGAASGGLDGSTSDGVDTTESGETGVDLPPCSDPFEGGQLLEILPFVGEEGVLGEKTGVGHDARRRLDLTTLTPETLITPAEDFFIRTEFPDQIDESMPWSITITGLVAEDRELPIDELLGMDHVSEVVCLECSGNGGKSRFGLMSAAEFSGVPLMDVLSLVDIDDSATMVLVSGFDGHTPVSTHSTPGASWTFTFDQIAAAGGMLVTQMNGEPISRDHGSPVRLLMPGWYGCCNAKWVNEIRLVDDTEPATAQMQEFASRTHQTGIPVLASEYVAATMDQTAMVTRVEKWLVDGQILYKIVGIMWGGSETTDALVMEFPGAGIGPVEVCPAQTGNLTWTLWSAAFSPPSTGMVALSMQITDPAITTKRLDTGYYTREVVIDEI